MAGNTQMQHTKEHCAYCIQQVLRGLVTLNRSLLTDTSPEQIFHARRAVNLIEKMLEDCQAPAEAQSVVRLGLLLARLRISRAVLLQLGANVPAPPFAMMASGLVPSGEKCN